MPEPKKHQHEDDPIEEFINGDDGICTTSMALETTTDISARIVAARAIEIIEP